MGQINQLLAAAALGAAKMPMWHAPKATALGPVIVNMTQEDQYHPRVGSVQAALKPLSSSTRQQVLQTRLSWLQQRKSAAENALRTLGVSTQLPSTLTPSQVALSDWPLTSVKRRVVDKWYRLRTPQSADPVPDEPPNVNSNTDRAFAALSDATIVGTDAASEGPAASLLLQMRCLADVYERWEIGALVAANLFNQQFATPALSAAEMLARVLTYFRIEGDMSVPPEDATLEGSDPGSNSSIRLPPGRSRFSPFLWPSCYMDCVTCLFDPASTTLDLSLKSTRVSRADSSFAIALGGLDVLVDGNRQVAEELRFLDDPNPFTASDSWKWPALNRQGSNPWQDAVNDFNTRQALLTEAIKGPPTATTASRISIVGTSADPGSFAGIYGPVRYAALIISEGVRYLNRLAYGPTRFGDGAPTQLPEIIVYLMFHMGGPPQMDPPLPPGDAAYAASYKAMLASAAAHALLPQSNSSYAKALRSAMIPFDPSLHQILMQVRAASNTDAVQIARDNWKQIAALLSTSKVMTALGAYIQNEDDSIWKSWINKGKKSHPRANCIGYAQLYDYLVSEISGT